MIVDAADAARRIIEPDRFIADKAAFVDVRLPGSKGKASYSFIGPGVSQNMDQSINIAEPHGFNVGAASMPHGVINNPHMHYTAEVFICTRGRWEIRVGQHGEQTLEIGPGDVFSAPTWVFRGFTNIGDDDGWLFAVLGEDDTGGIIWAPQVLAAAAETGLHLGADNSVIDTERGETVKDVTSPLDEQQLQQLDSYTDDEIQSRVVRWDDLAWSDSALLTSVLPDHVVDVAPVIGFGLTEDRHHRSPISNAHGFSLEWIRIAPGSSLGLHRVDQPRALILESGRWEITYNQPEDQVRAHPVAGSVVSVPAGTWHNMTNVGDIDALALVVCNSDSPTKIDWDDELIKDATRAGWGLDAGGFIAPIELLARRS